MRMIIRAIFLSFTGVLFFSGAKIGEMDARNKVEGSRQKVQVTSGRFLFSRFTTHESLKHFLLF
jgi:hypothetical protein